MPRPAKSLTMARRALSALLASIEIGNKPTIAYREETFCLLLVNAWEILLKARIVQTNNNRVEAIYQRQKGGEFHRNPQTGTPYTIDFMRALNLASVTPNAESNLLGLNAMRNDVAHMGVLSHDFRQRVLVYGSAAVVNFAKMYEQWFTEPVRIPYLLPVAFIGKSAMIHPMKSDMKQRQVLNYLDQLANSIDPADNDCSVILHLESSITPLPGGGGTIGITNDPDAPQLQLSDTQLLEHYPYTYADLVSEFKKRYSDFKANTYFHALMRKVKGNPEYVYQRKLTPRNPKSLSIWLYKLDPLLMVFDAEYTIRASR